MVSYKMQIWLKPVPFIWDILPVDLGISLTKHRIRGLVLFYF
jgi:hypothetical protein